QWAEEAQRDEESRHQQQLAQQLAQQRTFFAEKARDAAEQQERVAERLRQTAEEQRQEAEKQRQIAILKSKEADQLRQRAVEQTNQVMNINNLLASQKQKLWEQLSTTDNALIEAQKDRDEATRKRDAAEEGSKLLEPAF